MLKTTFNPDSSGKKIGLLLAIMLFTASMAFGADLNESFEGTFPPTDWTVINNDGGTYTWVAYDVGTDAYDGSYVAQKHWESPSDDWLITPKLKPSPGHNNLSFWYMSSSSSWLEDFNVKLSTTGTNVADFTVDLGSITDAPNAWTEFTYDLSAYNGTEIYIAVQCVSDDDYYLYVDYFTGVELYVPAYPKPTDLTTSSITQTSAELDWTEAGTATTWEVEWGATGFTQGTGTTITGIASHPYTLNPPLTAGTTYDWYVRSDCGGGNYSDWAGPETFTTQYPPVTSFPWTEGFEDDWIGTPAAPPSWLVVDNNGDGDKWYQNTSTSYVHGGTKSATIHTDYNSANDDWLITPAIDLSAKTDYRLKFWTRARSSTEPEELQVLLSTTNTDLSSFTNVLMASTPIDFTTYTEYTISLATYSSTVYIAFVRNQAPADGYYLYLDDVTVEEIPTNPVFSIDPDTKDFGTVNLGESSPAQTFTITNTGGGTLTIDPAISITGTDATQFSLTDDNTYPKDLGAGENMTVDVTFEPTTEGAKTANLHIVDNIAKTEHDIPLSGTGYDATLTPPFTEDFSTWYPTDWSKAQGLLEAPVTFTSTTTCYWYEDGFANVGTTGAAKCNVYGTSRKEWMITPPINLGAKTNYQLEFDLALTDYGSTDPPESVGDDDKYAVIISTDNGTTWTSANTLQMWDNTTTPSFADISTTGEHITINLTGYTGLVKLGFYAESTVNNADNDLFVDNVQVREIPTTPVFSVNPTSKDFGTVNVGESSAAQTFTITNTGGGTLTIDPAISITGTDATQFPLTDVNTYPKDLGAGENMTVDVTFSPTSIGAKTANLHIVDNLAKTEHDIPLSGDGWNPNYGGGGAAQGGYFFANSTSGASGAPSQPTYSWYPNQTGGANEGTLIPATDFVNGSEDDGHTNLMYIFDDESNFTFFGNTYSQMYLSTNGTIGFGVIGDAWHSIGPDNIPSADGDDNMIAWCWDDLDYDDTSSPNVNIRISRLSNRTIVTFWQYPIYSYSGPWEYITAQVIIYKDGRIFIMYNDDESTYDQTTQDCAIGIENIDGTAGVGYRYEQTGGPIFGSNLALAFGTDSSTLPVELIAGSLTAEYTINEYDLEYVTINWATASETDVLGFYIWRSETDDFSTAERKSGLIPGQGTTSETHDYSFEDKTADVYTTYYYWLEVAYMGETSSYHGSVSFIPEEDNPHPEKILFTKLGNSYPNPVTNIATIKYQLKGSINEQDATIRIYNILGELVKTVQGNDGEAEVNVSDLSTGIYFYQLKTSSFNEVKKMMVIR